jgi:hypothetical protein
MGHRGDLAAIDRAPGRLEGLTPREAARAPAWLASRRGVDVDRRVPGLREELGRGWRGALLALAAELGRGDPGARR